MRLLTILPWYLGIGTLWAAVGIIKNRNETEFRVAMAEIARDHMKLALMAFYLAVFVVFWPAFLVSVFVTFVLQLREAFRS